MCLVILWFLSRCSSVSKQPTKTKTHSCYVPFSLIQLQYLLNVNYVLFSNIWDYNLLHLSSIGIKPFQCDRCGKKFTRAYSLKMHRLKHEGKRCFRCQICSATFTSFGEYKHHMRVSRHIIRKPRIYECKTCGAMFTNSGNLIVHLRSLNHEASELANYFQTRWGGAEHSKKI